MTQPGIYKIKHTNCKITFGNYPKQRHFLPSSFFSLKPMTYENPPG